MNLLLIGGGGREHALAWKLRQSPLLDRLYCAPGNAGIEAVADCVALDVADHAAVIGFCRENEIGLVVIGPEAPLVAGLADDLASGRHQGVRARRGPRHNSKAPKASPRISAPNTASPPAPIAASTTRPPPRPMWRTQRLPIVVKADGLAAGKGVVIAETRERGRCCDRRLLRRRVRRRRRQGRHRGVPRRRGSELLRAGRRRDRAPACHRAGPQARLRRRPGPQHRRHGRLFAGADHDACTLRASDGARSSCRRCAAMQARGTPFKGVLYAGLMLKNGAAEADRIQCALRRS